MIRKADEQIKMIREFHSHPPRSLSTGELSYIIKVTVLFLSFAKLSYVILLLSLKD